MRYVLICCAFWLVLASVILGASRRPQILMEDNLRTITDVPMERAVATGWKGWI